MKPILVCALLMAACGGAQSGGGESQAHPHEFYPMSEGAVWSYDVDTGVGEPPVLAVMQIQQMTGEQAVVTNNGGESSTYERRPEGIWHVEGEAWLLKAPLEVGTEWDSIGGRSARIGSIDEAVSTPSGDYSGCVRVDEEGGEDGRRLSTVYCREIGMTFQRISMQMDMGGEAGVTVRLRGYLPGPAI